jgi:exonuclease SbcD
MKKPIALILTDTHLKLDNIDLVNAIWQQAINKCKELKIDNIFFGGDFFTSRNAQPLDVLQEGLNIVKAVKEAKIKLFAISGNHDKVDLNSEKSYLDIYEPYLHLLCREQTMIFQTAPIGIYMVPYFKESGKYLEHLKEVIGMLEVSKGSKAFKCTKHILITHIAVTGVMNNDGSKVENNLTTDLFKAFDKVMTGHYHDQSKIDKNIFYIGSAYQANFGEDDQKGFTILFDDGSHEFIQSDFPKYIKHIINISDTKKVKEVLKNKQIDSADNIRIVFTGDDTQLSALNKEKFAEKGIDVKFEKEVIRQDLSAVLKSNTTFDRSNIKEAFNHFCKLNEYGENEKGLEYLEKLQS